MMLLWTFFVCNLGWASPLLNSVQPKLQMENQGLTLTNTAVMSSMGKQRSHFGLGYWKQNCSNTSSIFDTCWQKSVNWGINRQMLPPSKYDYNHIVHGVASVGWRTGQGQSQVGFFTGLAVDLEIGGLEEIILRPSIGFNTELQMIIPIKKESTILLSMSNNFKGLYFEPTFALGWGRRW